MAEPVSVAVLSTISSLINYSRILYQLKNTPDDVRSCLSLISLVDTDLSYLISLRKTHLSALTTTPAILGRLDGIIGAAANALLDVGRLLEGVREEANRGRMNVTGKFKWVLSDSQAFSRRVVTLQQAHNSVLNEIQGFKTKEGVGEIKGEMRREVWENTELFGMRRHSGGSARTRGSGGDGLGISPIGGVGRGIGGEEESLIDFQGDLPPEYSPSSAPKLPVSNTQQEPSSYFTNPLSKFQSSAPTTYPPPIPSRLPISDPGPCTLAPASSISSPTQANPGSYFPNTITNKTQPRSSCSIPTSSISPQDIPAGLEPVIYTPYSPPPHPPEEETYLYPAYSSPILTSPSSLSQLRTQAQTQPRLHTSHSTSEMFFHAVPDYARSVFDTVSPGMAGLVELEPAPPIAPGALEWYTRSMENLAIASAATNANGNRLRNEVVENSNPPIPPYPTDPPVNNGRANDVGATWNQQIPPPPAPTMSDGAENRGVGNWNQPIPPYPTENNMARTKPAGNWNQQSPAPTTGLTFRRTEPAQNRVWETLPSQQTRAPIPTYPTGPTYPEQQTVNRTWESFPIPTSTSPAPTYTSTASQNRRPRAPTYTSTAEGGSGSRVWESPESFMALSTQSVSSMGSSTVNLSRSSTLGFDDFDGNEDEDPERAFYRELRQAEEEREERRRRVRASRVV
jgi:hypothetical protein